jgi:hypothetical protein
LLKLTLNMVIETSNIRTPWTRVRQRAEKPLITISADPKTEKQDFRSGTEFFLVSKSFSADKPTASDDRGTGEQAR